MTLMLKPDSALSKSQLRRRRKAGFSIPGVYTTNENMLQAQTLNKLSAAPFAQFVEGFTPDPPRFAEQLEKIAAKRNIANKRKTNDNV